MESRQLFTDRPSSGTRIRLRRSRPLPLAIASIVLPGSGHFFLGRVPLATALLLTALLAPPAAIAARTLLDPPWNNVGWLIGRLAVLAAVFAVWDAPVRALEKAARRRERGLSPRWAAYLNATGYGLAQLRLGDKGLGILAILAGGGAHIALVLFAPGFLRWTAELIPLALAVWGYRNAEEFGTPRIVSTEFGESARPAPGLAPVGGLAKGRGEHDPLPLPTWWLSTTAAVALVWVLIAGFLWTTHGLWLGATRVDVRSVVQMEPYYRNPAYDLALEMHAPGWSFRAAPEHTFVVAQHPAERTQVQLGLRPRVPWWDDPVDAAATELELIAREGLALTVVEEGESNLAGRTAYRVRGRGLRDGALREVELRLLPIGHRRYVLRMEWDPEHGDFARAELRGLMEDLRIEGKGGTPTGDAPASQIAR